MASEADCGGVLAHFCCFSGNLLTYLLSYILVVEATIKENMNNTLVSMISLLQLLLLLIDVIMTSAQRDTVQVTSFRKPRKFRNGPVMCALDPANETVRAEWSSIPESNKD